MNTTATIEHHRRAIMFAVDQLGSAESAWKATHTAWLAVGAAAATTYARAMEARHDVEGDVADALRDVEEAASEANVRALEVYQAAKAEVWSAVRAAGADARTAAAGIQHDVLDEALDAQEAIRDGQL